jgi:hypothetical protein
LRQQYADIAGTDFDGFAGVLFDPGRSGGGVEP